MFNPQICSRSEVNQSQDTELSPDLFVATVKINANSSLTRNSARNFLVAICHLLGFRNFFPIDLLSKRNRSLHHYMPFSLTLSVNPF